MRCSGDEDKARAAGCDGYVTKPFSPRQLLAKVREYLPSSVRLSASSHAQSAAHPDRRRQRRPTATSCARGWRRRATSSSQAADGEEALAAAREQLPDLILLDIMMPKLDGIEVCRRMKADASAAVHADHPGDRQGRHRRTSSPGSKPAPTTI